jgi:hypothetical protein
MMTNASASGSSAGPGDRITDEQRIAELKQLIHQALGYSLEPEMFVALADIQMNLWRRDALLYQWFEEKSISPQEYLYHMDSAMVRAMDDSRNLLGATRFSKIFGDVGNHPKGMIDHEAFLSGL